MGFGTICGFKHSPRVLECIPCGWRRGLLLRLRSPTRLGQNLESLCYSGFNNRDNNYDGDEHNVADDEELPEKSKELKDVWPASI